MDKRQLIERDICTKFNSPALEQAGWDIATQVREELPLTKGRIIVRGARARNIWHSIPEASLTSCIGRRRLLNCIALHPYGKRVS